MAFILLWCCSARELEPDMPADTDVPADTCTSEKTDTTDVPVPTSLKYSELLDEMISYDAMTRYPAVPYESRQESSRDRRSTDSSAPEWFANDDGWGYERYEYPAGRVEKVIFDEQHPGVITRMWLTSFGSPSTILRFYFDGADEPSWVVNTFNLKEFASYAGMSLGDALAQPSQEWIRGSSMYLPVTYAKGCKITIEELVEPTSVSRYYHINYRRYPDAFDIPTLTPELMKANSSKIKIANNKLLAPEPLAGETLNFSDRIKVGDALAMELPSGTNALNSLVVSVAVDDYSTLGKALQGLVIEGTFDGVRTVALPLVQLAGCGRGAYYTKSWRFESDAKGTLTMRWVMPYRSTASLVLHNMSEYDVELNAEAVVGSYSWDNRSLYFHAAYKSEQDVPIRYWSDYANGYEWNFASVSGGRGVYVGDVYTINNYTAEWPGEGDEKIWVDDESFPSHFGTGVEDYFSFCGYFRFHTPFSGEPRLDASNFKGYNIHYRTRNLDAIPFNSSLKFDLEMEGHAVGNADLESAIFYYGDASVKASGVKEYD